MANNYHQIRAENAGFKRTVEQRQRLLAKRRLERLEQLKKRSGEPYDEETLLRIASRLRARRLKRRKGRGFRGNRPSYKAPSGAMSQERLEEMRAKMSSAAYIDFAIKELAEGVISGHTGK